MLFHGEEQVIQGTQANGQIRATNDQFPTSRGGLLAHIRDFYIAGSLTTVCTTTPSWLLNDVLLPCFSTIDIKLTSGEKLYETSNSRMLKLIEMLYYGVVDDWPCGVGTYTYELKFPIPLNWHKNGNKNSHDRPDYTYLYPADEFEEFIMPFNAAATADQSITATWYLVADIVWLPERVRAPVRKWRNITESGQEIALPGGKYQMAYILNTKGADANRYDAGIVATGANYELKNVDGRWLQHQWFWDTIGVGGIWGISQAVAAAAVVAPVAAADVVDGGQTFDVNNVVQPLIWEKSGGCLPEHGIIGPMKFRRAAADPAMADMFVLESFG